MAPLEMKPSFIQIIDTFVTSYDDFMGVFTPTYEGGDFCVGVTLGYYGINMIEKVAKILYDDKPKVSTLMFNDKDGERKAVDKDTKWKNGF